MAARGEGTIQIGNREVQILFTNRALAGAEKRLGKGIVAVAEGFTDGTSGISEVAILLHVGMEAARVDSKAGGKPIAMSDAFEVLDDAGFTNVAGPVMEAVAAVLGYSCESQEDGQDPNE